MGFELLVPSMIYEWMIYLKIIQFKKFDFQCIVIDRGRPAHLTASDYGDSDVANGPGEEEASVIVQLTNRVQDGTRCRSGSLDMCIQGKCQVSLLAIFGGIFLLSSRKIENKIGNELKSV